MISAMRVRRPGPARTLPARRAVVSWDAARGGPRSAIEAASEASIAGSASDRGAEGPPGTVLPRDRFACRGPRTTRSGIREGGVPRRESDGLLRTNRGTTRAVPRRRSRGTAGGCRVVAPCRLPVVPGPAGASEGLAPAFHPRVGMCPSRAFRVFRVGRGIPPRGHARCLRTGWSGPRALRRGVRSRWARGPSGSPPDFVSWGEE